MLNILRMTVICVPDLTLISALFACNQAKIASFYFAYNFTTNHRIEVIFHIFIVKI